MISGSGGNTLALNGGLIYDNAAYTGGGIYYRSSSGSFTINGGTISGNHLPANDNSYKYGGGFTLLGGTINGNTAGSGGGVYVNGTFTMKGGSIQSNTGAGGYNSGGGIHITSSGAFAKTPGSGGGSGIVYGTNEAALDPGGTPLKNSGGRAMYYAGSPAKARSATADETVHLSTASDENWTN